MSNPSRLSLPTRLPCGSFLAYAPYGSGSLCSRSRAIKQLVKKSRIEGFMSRLRERGHEPTLLLEGCLGREVTLVPVPRSKPLVPGEPWPGMKIAELLQRAGLAAEIRPLLERTETVQKSSSAKREGKERLTAIEHTMTIAAKRDAGFRPADRVTLVDDVVTAGNTFMGAAAVLLSAYPQLDVSCFAMIRTVSDAENDEELGRIDAPLVEMIRQRNGKAWRR